MGIAAVAAEYFTGCGSTYVAPFLSRTCEFIPYCPDAVETATPYWNSAIDTASFYWNDAIETAQSFIG